MNHDIPEVPRAGADQHARQLAVAQLLFDIDHLQRRGRPGFTPSSLFISTIPTACRGVAKLVMYYDSYLGGSSSVKEWAVILSAVMLAGTRDSSHNSMMAKSGWSGA